MGTIQAERDPSLDEQRCAEIVGALLARHAWQLLEPADFLRRTLEAMRKGIGGGDPQRAAIHVFSLALYQACSGDLGAEQQNLAYADLFRYLYDVAQGRYPDVCEEAAQRATERIFMSFARCRLPGAFVAFSLQHLMDATRALRRHQQRRAWPLSAFDANRSADGELSLEELQADPVEHALAAEQRSRFEQLAARFLQKHPRAAQQFAALRLKFIDGLDEMTISLRLGKPVSSIYVLRSRAIEKLRAEPEWRTFASELGLLPEE